MVITRNIMKKCINNKRFGSAILALLVLLIAGAVLFCISREKDDFFLKEYANADAKFYDDYILTSVDESIYFLDFQGETLKTYEGLKASWLYTYPEEGLVVYSNHENETHLMKLDKALELEWDRVILRTDLLAIDPTICKVEDTYLVTHTTIEGTINNPSPDGENGLYSLELYASKDLIDFEYRGTIVSEKHDIEDIDLVYEDGRLYCIYEKEAYDKGPSKICMRFSEDEGVSFSKEQILIDNGGDNEPACILKDEKGWRLFYSSDLKKPGTSYNGASAYSAVFDENFQMVEGTDQKIPMRDNQGIRLYEVTKQEDRLYFMFAHNYMTDKDFVLRSIEENKLR